MTTLYITHPHKLCLTTEFSGSSSVGSGRGLVFQGGANLLDDKTQGTTDITSKYYSNHKYGIKDESGLFR